MAAPARATMDFFAAQAAARRRTWVLVLWFALAFAGTIAAVWAGLGVVLRLWGPWADLAFGTHLAGGSAAGVAAITLAGAAYHRARLSAGGGAVATLLGGVPVDRDTRDPAERRLVNVVEEMAIAAGLPVPGLFVLPDEAGINAFAAGFTPDRAVVAVTRGALDRLTRDELQGVVAHELSHVLNGDARLNLQLLSLLGGITALAAVGRVLVGARRRRLRHGRRDPTVPLALAGLVVWVAGSVGAFFGRVIRAAVSRQREFLADAAAVQFTRNPDGLAGALARIGREGSRVESAFAPEASHLFFANGLRSSWLATHPPIPERIRRIAPAFLGEYARAAVAEAIAHGRRDAGTAAPPVPAGVASLAPDGGAAAEGVGAARAVVASVGHPGPGHLALAGSFLSRLAPDVAVATRHAAGARALATALLLDPAPAARDAQLARVAPDARADAARLAPAIAAASREDRMALLDLALPSLDALERGAAAALVRDLAAVAAADGRTTVFEWAVQRVVRRRLARNLGEAGRPGFRPRAVEDVQVELLELLSTLAWLGARDEAGAQAALDAATAAAGIAGGWRPLPRERARASAVDAALERLDGANLALKGRVLAACAACALADGRLAPAEAEVVRAVAASLGLPVPPLERPAPEAPARSA